MIILDRKKILFILGIVSIFVFLYTFTAMNVSNISKEKNQTIATVALPVDNKTIVIDAGHGVPDEGAQSSSRNNRSPK